MHIVCGISTDFVKTSNGQALQNITIKQGYDILSAFIRVKFLFVLQSRSKVFYGEGGKDLKMLATMVG